MEHLIETAPPEILPHMKKIEYAAGQPILVAGNESHHIYLLLHGSAEGYIQNAKGDVSSVYSFHSGTLFGEVEIFSSNIITLGITATTPCTVCQLHRQYFLQWMQADFEFTSYVIRQMCEKLAGNSILMEKLSLLTVKQRVLRQVAIRHFDGSLQELTKDILCVEAGAPLRSINRAIASCDGIIAYSKKRFRVVDEKRLPEVQNER